MYDDVRAHIQEMLDIGAIQKSHSPQASAVVLVQQKGWQPEVLYWPQESWASGPLRTHIQYPKMMKHMIVYKALNGSHPSTWSQDTGRFRWMRKVNHWLCSQWGHWAFTSAKGCLSDSPTPPATFHEANGDLSWGPQSPLVHHLFRWHSHLLQGSSLATLRG